MSRRHNDFATLEEIRRLQANLVREQFQPLSTGFGLGQVVPRTVKSAELKHSAGAQAAAAIASLVPPTSQLTPPTVTEKNEKHSSSSAPAPKVVSEPTSTVTPTSLITSGPKFWRRGMAVVIDGIFVTASIVGGLLAMDRILGHHSSLSLTELSRSLPMILLQQLGVERSLIGLGIAFIVYWLFFRLVAGATIAEFLLRTRLALKAE